MGKLILVRHGESEANRDQVFAASGEVPLTDLGRQQAHELAQRIAKRFAPARIITSTFLRARQTAEILAAELKLPVEVFEGIHERDLGSLKGDTYSKQLDVALQDQNYDPRKRWLWRPPEGESYDDVRQRVVPALEELRNRYPDEDLLVVSHGAVMLCAWAHFAKSWDNAHGPSNCGIFLIPHADGRFDAPEIIKDQSAC